MTHRAPLTHRILCRVRPSIGPVSRGHLASLLGIALLVAVSACAYRGDIDNPAVRRFQWFSYVQGDDIEASCGEGTPDFYRLVYNADFLEQVRSYEVTGDGSGGGWLIARAVPNGAALANVTLTDLHGWWAWHRSEEPLDAATVADLHRRLTADGFFERRDGLVRLNSRDFYWLVSACVDGKFERGAWLNGPIDLSALTFPALLYAHDDTGLAVAAPRPVKPGDRYRRGSDASSDVTITPFWITVDDRPLAE